MNNPEYVWLFGMLLLVVAALYASVGHGGASGYLALMALFGFSPVLMKSSSLLLNIFVSFIAFWQYFRGGYFRWNLFVPFAIASVPAAFLGSWISVDAVIYKQILGALLIFPVLRLLGLFGKEKEKLKAVNLPAALLIGTIIGVLSGMIGIGGGIILSPLILLFGWGTMKETAAVSALFIFVNSLSGFGGLISKGIQIDPLVWLWLGIAITGGFAGAYLGRKMLNNIVLKRVLAFVLVIASIKLLTVK